MDTCFFKSKPKHVGLYIYLYGIASSYDQKAYVDGVHQTVEKGSIVDTIFNLGKFYAMSHNNFKNALNDLQEIGLITIKKIKVTTVITIVDFDLKKHKFCSDLINI